MIRNIAEASHMSCFHASCRSTWLPPKVRPPRVVVLASTHTVRHQTARLWVLLASTIQEMVGASVVYKLSIWGLS
jgi:hypothetical protein